MEEMNITAEARTGEGVKGALSKIRAEKKVPAVIYGGHKNPVSITVSLKDLEKIMKAGKNTVVEITRYGIWKPIKLKSLRKITPMRWMQTA